MGLQALEFTDCLTDSPFFRETLHSHEKELERTSSQIKGLIKDVKEILHATRLLSRAQRALAASLESFHFECIGNNQTDDEIVIAKSLQHFGQLLTSIEDERDRMLEKAHDQFIKPLDDFRKTKIGGVKEGKKKFEKQTTKFCQSQERYLNLSTKKQNIVLQEADASLDMEQRHFCHASLKYVYLLQEVQECKKYEFVETLLGFMYSLLTFYHQGHEVAADFKPYMTDLQTRLQKTRENFETTRDQTKLLMIKMLEIRKSKDSGSLDKTYSRQGYLYLMEKKALGTTWTKYYCTYEKSSKKFTMIPYNQNSGKLLSQTGPSDEIFLKSCTRRPSDSIDKRFCFDLMAEGRIGVVYTFQALGEEDRRLWLEAMDGREPTYGQPGKIPRIEETYLDDVGFSFVQQCIAELESRGLEEQGLYRLVGVSSKVSKLLNLGLDRRKGEKLVLTDRLEWETKTITSALKTYFRNLPEPVMTFRFHGAFIAAAKQETRNQRVQDVHTLVHRLPLPNFQILDALISHLNGVAAKSDKNKMTVCNLGVCFGPTLLRPEEETVAAIMDIKFCNVVVEILIENYHKIFTTKPSLMEAGDDTTVSKTPSVLYGVSPSRQHLVHKDHVHQSYLKSGRSGYIDSGIGGRSSWENLPYVPGTGLHQSTATVNSLHSSSQSSSSNHSVGDVLSLGDSLSANAPNDDRERVQYQQSAKSIYGSQTEAKPTANYLSSYLTSTGTEADRVTSNSSSSSDSVASWQMTGPPPQKGQPVRPPPYQPPPDHRSSNGRHPLNLGAATGASTTSLNSGKSELSVKRARTLYSCIGEHDGELSFEPNEIIHNIRSSCEPGWLEGTLRGKTGLIPENYVEPLP